MSLIQLRNIHKAYGPRVIFEDESVDLAKGDRVGLIGRNGAGKSTLCKVLLGQEELDGGQVIRGPQLALSWLEQHTPFEPGEAVLPFLMRYTGEEEWKCGKIAGRFHLKHELLGTPIDELAGGFQTRVKLVAMLLGDPNFLVLDEPTNYLDLKTLILLERFLADFSGGYLIVSHDREFLKRTCDKTLEVDRGRLMLFPGDVESYAAYREEQKEQAVRYNRNVEAQRKHLQSFVDRYRVRASTASRAQSKLKQMERLRTIEIDHPMSAARIRLPRVEEKKGVALRCEGLEIGYPDRSVASDVRLEVERGNRVAVLGDNGQGKTTFLRTIAGALAPRAGEFRWGHNLRPGYYAQHVYRALSSELDVQTYLEQHAAKDVLPQDVLDMAGSFLFQGDEVRKPVTVLSGGERARLCLAGLLLSKCPVLLLDEPTNHLDFETVEALGRALRDYNGTLFFVSHDRTFVSLVATNIVEVVDGSVTLYPGDYAAYVYQTERAVDDEEAAVAREQSQSASAPKVTDYHRRKELRSQIGRLQKRVARAEDEVARYQEEKDAINRHFLENPMDPALEKQRRMAELERLLAEAEDTWLALQQELEGLEAESA